MISPTEADLGRAVLYVPFWQQDRTSPPEEGVVTSFNDRYVFVRYGAKKGSEATERRDLEWVAP